MLSLALTNLLRNDLQVRVPKLVYWLHYAEMAISILLGIFMLNFADDIPLMATLVGIAFFINAGLDWIGACDYNKRNALARGGVWSPSRFDQVVALFTHMGGIAIALFILWVMFQNRSEFEYAMVIFIIMALMLLWRSSKGLREICLRGWI